MEKCICLDLKCRFYYYWFSEVRISNNEMFMNQIVRKLYFGHNIIGEFTLFEKKIVKTIQLMNH